MSTGEIPLSRPNIGTLEEQLVLTVLRSGRLSIGPMLETFEALVCERTGCAHAVAVNSGTSGLHLALAALGVGPGDEVIVHPMTFVATVNAVLMVGARPVFVDLEPTSLNMDPAQVEAAITPRTKAIMAVENLGCPTHMDAYAQIAGRHEIPLVEDSCEALGTVHKGTACGAFGRVGLFAFYANKQVTTGEGGMIVTDDPRLAEACRSMRNQGRGGSMRGAAGSWLAHERLGYNYRLDELSAALGVAQMRRLDELIDARAAAARLYLERLSSIPELVLPTVDPDTRMSWFVFVVRLAAGYSGLERDRIIERLRAHEIGAADYFPCLHTLPHVVEALGGKAPRMPIAESICQRTIALPFYPGLGEAEVEVVAQTLELLIGREGIDRG